MRDNEFTKILGWPGYRVFRHENDETAMTLRLWERRKRGDRKLICSGCVHALYGALYPIYMRGEAYLALERGAEAAAEFQKILDHRGILISDPIGALTHLQLGRAYALSGEVTKAKSAFQGFLTLW